MTERYIRNNRGLKHVAKAAGVAGLSAAALLGGASKVKAGVDAPVRGPGMEMVQNRLSIHEAQAQAQEKLVRCQDINFLRGSVVALNPGTGESMFSVDHPILVLRDQVQVGEKQPSQWIFNHPGDPEHWAIGYIDRNGKMPTMAMINPKHAKLVFNIYKKNSQAPAVDAFRCNLDETGQPDIEHPLNVVGQLLSEPTGQPIEIGVRTASSGFLNIPFNKAKFENLPPQK